MKKRWLTIPVVVGVLMFMAPSAAWAGSVPTPLWYSNQSLCQSRLGKNAPCDTSHNVASCGFGSSTTQVDIHMNSIGGSYDVKDWLKPTPGYAGGWSGYNNYLYASSDGQNAGFQCDINYGGTGLEDAFTAKSGGYVDHLWWDSNGFHHADIGVPSGANIVSVGATWYDSTHLEVFAVSVNGYMYWIVYTQGTGWGTWHDISGTLGTTSALSVSAASYGAGDLELMAIGKSDRAVCHAYMRSYVWNGSWECPVKSGYGDTVYIDAGEPTVGRGSGGMDVVVVNQSNGHVYHICATNNTWCSAWDDLGTPANVLQASGDWVWGGSGYQYDVFAATNSQLTGLWHNHWVSGWSGWCYGGDMGGSDSPVGCGG